MTAKARHPAPRQVASRKAGPQEAGRRETGAQDVREHDARRPSAFGLADWRAILGRVWARIAGDHLVIIAAGVAFWGVLSIFPALAALVAIYGFFANPADVQSNLEAVRPVVPGVAYELIEAQVASLVTVGQQQLGIASIVALLFALWTARVGVMALVEGLNMVYRERDGRSFLLQYLLSLALTLIMVVVAALAILAVVLVPTVLHFAEIGPLGAWLARVTPLAILGAAMVFVIGGLYRYAPHRAHARKRWVSYGAVLATLLWALASLLLQLYFSTVANLNHTYGSLGAIAGLMFWIYVTALIVLLGAELNAEMELQTSRDTTVGPPRPMGERGAFVADHVALDDHVAGAQPEPGSSDELGTAPSPAAAPSRTPAPR